jgi:hypothetical protein
MLYWHPQLSIDDASGDLKQRIRYSAKKTKRDIGVCIYEYREMKGLFWEKLELKYFPSDVQDLSLSMAFMFYDDKVILVPDPPQLIVMHLLINTNGIYMNMLRLNKNLLKNFFSKLLTMKKKMGMMDRKI